MGKKSDPPDPPDYASAARQEAKASKELTEQQTYANRPRQVTPWGTVDWDVSQQYDPVSDQELNRWTQTLNLSPDQAAALRDQMNIQSGRSGLALNMMGRMGEEFGDVMDWGQFQPYGSLEDPGDVRTAAEEAIYGKATSRLDPMWEDRVAAEEVKLRNQGLVPGSEAYDNAMRNLEFAKTDAYQQALMDSVRGGGVEAQRQFGMNLQEAGYENTLRQAQIAEEMQRRGFTLNEINAILTGTQVGMPNMPSFNMAARSDTPEMLRAAQMGYQGDVDRYSADQAKWQGIMSGGAGLLSLAF